MQVQYEDGTYGEPRGATRGELSKALAELAVPDEPDQLPKEVGRAPQPQRVLIFAAHDKHGRPTKELRRAWRRHRRSPHTV